MLTKGLAADPEVREVRFIIKQREKIIYSRRVQFVLFPITYLTATSLSHSLGVRAHSHRAKAKKNQWKRWKKKFQTTKKIFAFVFAFCRCEWTLRATLLNLYDVCCQADTPWYWDTLFTEVTSELLTEWERKEQPSEEDKLPAVWWRSLICYVLRSSRVFVPLFRLIFS